MDFDSLPDDTTAAAPTAATPPTTTNHIDFDSLPDDNEKYGTPLEQVKAGAEGVARGVLGPVAPLAERYMLGVKPEAMRGREEANPVTAGVGEAAGLVGGALTGTGEAALLEHAGEGAAKLAGLANPTSYIAKVGSSAVKQAAEMAVFQGGDEVAKTILNDPNASAESAISNIGLSAALGGVTGGFITGAVSPLWKVTVGDKLESFLGGLKSHLNGEGGLALPETLQKAYTDLGIEPHPVIKSAMSGDKRATEYAQELYRAQNPEMLEHLNALPSKVAEAVTQGLGIPLEEAASFSNAQSGEAVREAVIRKINEEYGPLAERLNQRNAEAATIAIPDETRLEFGNRMMQHAISDKGPGTNSPYYKIYENYAQRVLGEETVGGLDRIKTELGKKKSLDGNESHAWGEIRKMINDFQEQQIASQSKGIMRESAPTLEEIKAGIDKKGGATKRIRAAQAEAEAKAAQQQAINEGKSIGADVINARAEVNRNYAEYANKMDELTSHLGIGDFRGTGGLKAKLEELSPEQVIKKFSTKGDAKSAAFLKKEFPEVAELVRQHEAKQFLAPSIHDVHGETTLDVKKLSNRLDNLMKGSPEHAAYVLPPGAVERIQAAKVINDAISKIKSIKDSGTPAGIAKIFKHFGAGAIGSIGWIMGHNPVGAALLGELAQRMGKDMPEAYKLAMLKMLGSDQPVKAEGFKAMADFMHATYKGENLLAKGTSAMFKAGLEVIPSKLYPTPETLKKLDKQVSDFQKDPQKLEQLTNGQTGHYMPEHQAALSATSTRAMAYLQSIKPQPYRSGPLDAEIAPSDAQMQRYNRALSIAQQPLLILQHAKDGTLQATDIQDLNAMYPAMYPRLVQKVSNAMLNAHSDETLIPYHTRMGVSLLIGQPVDSSMSPMNIIAAQPIPVPPPQQQAAAPKRKGMSSLGKSESMYKTASQSAESNRIKHS